MWQHIDGGGCPGQGIGVRTRLDSGITGFIHIKNLSDKQVKNVEDRVQVKCSAMWKSRESVRATVVYLAGLE